MDDHVQGHHEQQPAVKAKFLHEVKDLVTTFNDLGNPFEEESEDLLVFDTTVIVDKDIIHFVRSAESIGLDQYNDFVQNRLVDCTTPVTDALKKNKLPLFSAKTLKTNKKKDEIKSLKNDCRLFSRLYIACQSRDGDLNGFFSHENQPTPPALSQNGLMKLGNKSSLLPILEEMATACKDGPEVDVLIIDGSMAVQMLQPKTSKTFLEYSRDVFIPYVTQQLQRVRRLDIVWDVYLKTSLKASMRQKRGKGTRCRVALSTRLPKNWADFLQVDDNKTAIFSAHSPDHVASVA